jgi:hypothetical protein
MIRRTQEDILARIASTERADFLGVIRSDLLEGLSFDNAKQFLKDGVTAEQWTEAAAEFKPPLDAARSYMEFAWDKANNCRGISASRSVQHFESWLWLAGADGFDAVSDAEYQFYGKPCLVIAATALGVDWRALDDGIWDNDEGGDRPRPGEEEIARLEAIGAAIREEMQVPA